MSVNPTVASKDPSLVTKSYPIPKAVKYALALTGTALLVAGAVTACVATLGLAGIGIGAVVGLSVAAKAALVGVGTGVAFVAPAVCNELSFSESFLKHITDFDTNSLEGGESPKPTHGIGFINGIAHNLKTGDEVLTRAVSHACTHAADAHTREESDQRRRHIRFWQIYNATHTPVLDLMACATGSLEMKSPPVHLLRHQWDEFFRENPEGEFLQICHSQGALHTFNALKGYKHANRIRVLAVAPAKAIPPGLCKEAVNVRSKGDPIPLIMRSNVRHLHVLERHPEAKKFDHGILSPTYEPIITESIESFINGRSIENKEVERQRYAKMGLLPYNPHLAIRIR